MEDDAANWSAEKVAEVFASGASIFDGTDSSEDEEVAVEGDMAAAKKAFDHPEAVVFTFGDVVVKMGLPTAGLDADISAALWRATLLCAARLAGLKTVLSTGDGDDVNSPDVGVGHAGGHNFHGYDWENSTVLELGCGRGLPSILAIKLGAKSVCITDCDDRALLGLVQSGAFSTAMAAGGHHTLNHLLWEQDLNHTAVAASQADTSVPQSERLQHEKVRHWADAYRLPQQFAALEPNKQYDLVIASDCLYFLCQEESLAASIYARVRKPNGKALVVFQPRSTTGQGTFQIDRFTAMLTAYGMQTDTEGGPWDWASMRDEVIRGNAAEGQEDVRMSRTANEHDGPFVITAYWPATASATAGEELDPSPKQAFNDVAFWKVPHATFDLDEALAVVGKGGGAASASAVAAV